MGLTIPEGPSWLMSDWNSSRSLCSSRDGGWGDTMAGRVMPGGSSWLTSSSSILGGSTTQNLFFGVEGPVSGC